MKRIAYLFAMCLIVFLMASEVDAAVQQTKFNPGPYITINPTISLNTSGRQAKLLAAIRNYGKEASVRGLQLSYRWKDLEPSKDNYSGVKLIGEALDEAAKYNKQITIFIKARTFGSHTCAASVLPAYIKNGMTYAGGNDNNKSCMPMWWKSEPMGRYIKLLNEIGKLYDSHPNLEAITEGETTISKGPGFSTNAYHTQMKRLITEGKKALPTTPIIIEMNFYHGSETDLLNHMVATGGMAMGVPDSVVCRLPVAAERNRIANTYGARNSCGYVISNFALMPEYGDRIGIMPNSETWDMMFTELEASYRMAGEYMEADHFQVQESFCSRRDGGCKPGYAEKQILPTFRKVGNIMRPECPSTYGTCIENDGSIEYVGDGGGGADYGDGSSGDGGDGVDYGSGTTFTDVYGVSCKLFKTAPYVAPAGFALAYHPLTIDYRWISDAYCKASNNTFQFLMPTTVVHGVQYVWKYGYVAKPGVGKWEQVEIEGEPVEGASNWLNGELKDPKYKLDASRAEVAEPHVFLSYICTWDEGEWKCGCRDASCRDSYWNLQALQFK